MVDKETLVGSQKELMIDEQDFRHMTLVEPTHLHCWGLLTLGALKKKAQQTNRRPCYKWLACRNNMATIEKEKHQEWI